MNEKPWTWADVPMASKSNTGPRACWYSWVGCSVRAYVGPSQYHYGKYIALVTVSYQPDPSVAPAVDRHEAIFAGVWDEALPEAQQALPALLQQVPAMRDLARVRRAHNEFRPALAPPQPTL